MQAADVVVLRTSGPPNERFAIVRMDFQEIFSTWKSMDDFMPAVGKSVERQLRSAEAIDEPTVCRRLKELGMATEDIDRQLHRARNFVEFAAGWETTHYEHITRTGYRNEHGQTVIGKTDEMGTVAGQRLYTMRCYRCGHEYAVNGSETYRGRCARCDTSLGN